MKPRFFPSVFWAAFLALVPIISAVAQTSPGAAAPADIDVSNVRFDNVRIGSSSWYEAQIELTSRAGAATDNKRFLNRVKVTLNLGIFSVKAPSGAKVPDTYYRASAEAVAIEATGGRVVYRFYLPPEIVRRDTITGEQKFYFVELSVDGKPVALNPNTHFSKAAISTPEVLQSFRGEIAAKAGANDGILVPQYLTPFAHDSNRPTPTMVRVETAR